MKIISPFKDFYDSALAHGQDGQGLFVRKTSIMNDKEHKSVIDKLEGMIDVSWRTLPNINVYKKGLKHSFRAFNEDFITAFAIISGRAHKIYVTKDMLRRANTQENGHTSFDTGYALGVKLEDKKGFTSEEKIMDYVLSSMQISKEFHDHRDYTGRPAPPLLTEKDVELYIAYPKDSHYWYFQNEKEKLKLKEQTDRCIEKILNTDFSWLNMEMQTPVVLIATGIDHTNSKDNVFINNKHGLYVIRNPKLIDFGMQTVLNPFETFQSIEQFITGVMPGATSPTLTVSDKTQILKKGFDPKYGFRKRPEGF